MPLPGPGVKQAHLIIIGFRNPEEPGSYPVRVGVFDAARSERESGVGYLIVRPDPAPSINITSVFVPGDENEGKPPNPNTKGWIHLLAKQPGDQMNLKPVHLNLDFSESFKTRQLEAYERLLMDVIRGNLTLFVRRDELEVAWQWVEPIMAAWRESGEKPKNYTAGTWGPAAARALINRDANSWPEEG